MTGGTVEANEIAAEEEGAHALMTTKKAPKNQPNLESIPSERQDQSLKQNRASLPTIRDTQSSIAAPECLWRPIVINSCSEECKDKDCTDCYIEKFLPVDHSLFDHVIWPAWDEAIYDPTFQHCHSLGFYAGIKYAQRCLIEPHNEIRRIYGPRTFAFLKRFAPDIDMVEVRMQTEGNRLLAISFFQGGIYLLAMLRQCIGEEEIYEQFDRCVDAFETDMHHKLLRYLQWISGESREQIDMTTPESQPGTPRGTNEIQEDLFGSQEEYERKVNELKKSLAVLEEEAAHIQTRIEGEAVQLDVVASNEKVEEQETMTDTANDGPHVPELSPDFSLDVIEQLRQRLNISPSVPRLSSDFCLEAIEQLRQRLNVIGEKLEEISEDQDQEMGNSDSD